MSAAVASLLADALLVLHGLFIAWVVLGGFAAWRWPRVAWAHLPAAAWGVWIEWSGGVCPLTPLEWRLRALAGQAGYAGGWIETHLTAWIYPEGLTREIQWALGAAVLLLNLVLYGLAWRAWRRRRQTPPPRIA